MRRSSGSGIGAGSRRGRFHRAATVLAASVVAAAAVPLLGVQAQASAPPPPPAGPPVRHVWVVDLENTEYSKTFGAPGADNSYLTQVLPSLGMLAQGYFAIGHN